MSYLYGDSTPSSLEVNFVDFLGDCLDLCAQLLLSTESMRRERQNGDALRRAAPCATRSPGDARKLEPSSETRGAVRRAAPRDDAVRRRRDARPRGSRVPLVRARPPRRSRRRSARSAGADAGGWLHKEGKIRP